MCVLLRDSGPCSPTLVKACIFNICRAYGIQISCNHGHSQRGEGAGGLGPLSQKASILPWASKWSDSLCRSRWRATILSLSKSPPSPPCCPPHSQWAQINFSTLNQRWFNVEPQLSSTILNFDIWFRNRWLRNNDQPKNQLLNHNSTKNQPSLKLKYQCWKMVEIWLTVGWF